MKFILIPFVLMLYNSVYISAQNSSHEIDSMKKVLLIQKEDTNRVYTLIKLAVASAQNLDYPQGITLANQAIEISKKLNHRNELLEEYGIRAYCYQLMYKFDSARLSHFERLNIAGSLRDTPEIAKTYLSVAQIDDWDTRFQDAYENAYKALKLSELIQDKFGIASAKEIIGYVNFEQQHFDESFINYQDAMKIYHELNNYEAEDGLRKSIGDLYISQSKLSEAAESLKIALKRFENSENKFMTGSIYTSLGKVYEKIGDSLLGKREANAAEENYKVALDYDLKSLKINLSAEFNVHESYLNLGQIYFKLKDYKNSRENFDAGLRMSGNNKIGKSTGHLGLARLDSAENNYKRAFYHYSLYTLYKDSLINEEANKKAVQVQMQYEFDKKQSIAKIEQGKKDAETKRVKTQQYFAITALAIIVIAVIIIAAIQFRNNRYKQLANVALKNEKEKVEDTLSELRSTQSQLIQSEKMASLGQLTAGIAHEIQNPLNFVNNFSEVNNELIEEMRNELSVMSDESPGGAGGGINSVDLELLNDIYANNEKIVLHGKRADAIVKGMLEHSRQGTGEKQLTDINTLADEYLKLSYNGLRAKDKLFNATLKTDFDNTIGKINIVSQDIGRVLLNLYNNAFYAASLSAAGGFSKSDGSSLPIVEVITKKEGNKILISVKDNGPGIPDNIKDKIFQPFFTTKPTGQGTGLGLSLAYDIVKAHGGELTVNSGAGPTSFTVSMPVS